MSESQTGNWPDAEAADQSYRPFEQGGARFPAGSPQLETRMLQAFQGDPVGVAQQLTIDTVKGLTVPDAANSATVTVEAQPCRLRVDGVAATAGVGLLLPVGTVLVLTGRATLQSASFIGTVAGSIIDVAYFT